MGDYSVSWNAVYAAMSEIDVGDPVVINDLGEYELSTATLRTSLGNRKTSGIARTVVADPNLTGDIQHNGLIPAERVPQLGPGLQQLVRVTAIGGLERVATPGPTDDVIGEVDTNGNLSLSKGAGAGVTVPTAPKTVEIVFLANEFNTNINTGARVGGQLVDMSLYPATVDTFTREVRLVADLDVFGTPTSANARLFNVTDNEEVTGSEVSHTTTTNTEKVSGPLTVGGAAGNVRSDHPAQYAALLKMVGGAPASDRAIATSIRLRITYS